MRNILNKYVSEFGDLAIFDVDKLYDWLSNYNNLDYKLLYQYILILKCGNIQNFYQRGKDLTRVELNDLIIGCKTKTNLDMDVVKKCLYDILSVLKMNFLYEESFFVEKNNVNIQTIKDTAFLSYDEIDKELNHAKSLLSQDKNYDDAITILTRLCKCGSPEAMYELGMCYTEGKGTVVFKEKGFNYLLAASQNGNPKARAKLGKYYYNKGDYASAYECYTKAGVISVSSDAKKNIVEILNQKKTNLILLLLQGISVLIMWIFMIINPITIHHLYNLLGLSIPINIIATGVYILGLNYFYKTKFNNLKWISMILMLLYALNLFVLALN